MRLNKYIAQSTGVSRREADNLISSGRILVNDKPAKLGMPINNNDIIKLDNKKISLPDSFTYILINKPIGYVSTRRSQDNTPTVYDLLPRKYHQLKYIGRLDKDSSGALLLTDDGNFAHRMTHPRFLKSKIYNVNLDSSLNEKDLIKLKSGVTLDDGVSKLNVIANNSSNIAVEMHEGRNRQIRRTFESLGYKVKGLHRTKFGEYELGNLKSGEFIEVKRLEV